MFWRVKTETLQKSVSLQSYQKVIIQIYSVRDFIFRSSIETRCYRKIFDDCMIADDVHESFCSIYQLNVF
jgi:hypothetical protein